MILRYWRGRATEETAEAYLDHLRQTTLPELGAIDGHRGAYVLRREEDDGVEFVVLTLWESLESVRAFAGDDYETAVLPPEARRALASFDERVVHYEVASGPTGAHDDTTVNVRYLVDDVAAAVAFYTTHFGFALRSSAAPAFADVTRGNLRLLLSGRTSSAGRPMPDGRQPGPGGWNRIHLLVDDIKAEVDRLRASVLTFRNEIVTGPGGSQILLDDPSGNPLELFQPADRD